jgi:hypothetical protein
VPEGDDIPSGKVHLSFEPSRTHVYENAWLAGDLSRAAS